MSDQQERAPEGWNLILAAQEESAAIRAELTELRGQVAIGEENERHLRAENAALKAKTVHGGNVGTTPFYLYPWQQSNKPYPEYDQGHSVIVWYDDLVLLNDDKQKAQEENARLTQERDNLHHRAEANRTCWEAEKARADALAHELDEQATTIAELTCRKIDEAERAEAAEVALKPSQHALWALRQRLTALSVSILEFKHPLCGSFMDQQKRDWVDQLDALLRDAG